MSPLMTSSLRHTTRKRADCRDKLNHNERDENHQVIPARRRLHDRYLARYGQICMRTRAWRLCGHRAVADMRQFSREHEQTVMFRAAVFRRFFSALPVFCRELRC